MIRKQSGLTMISWMFIIGFVAIQLIMALRIIPLYMNHSTLKSIMDDLSVSTDVKGQTAKGISRILRKRLKVNNLYDLASDKDAFSMKKSKTGYTLNANYEARGPIFGNLSFLAEFEYSVDIITR